MGALWIATGGCGEQAPATTPATPSPAASTPAAGGDAKTEPARCPEPKLPLAQRVGVTLTEVCEKAAVDPMQLDPALDLALTGTWKGEYLGDGRGSDGTRFDASLFATGGVVSGTTTEPNTFGPYDYAELQADLVGEAHATREVVLLKTYRTATITHSVLYVGRLDAAGKRIEGRWRLRGLEGTFWMERS